MASECLGAELQAVKEAKSENKTEHKNSYLNGFKVNGHSSNQNNLTLEQKNNVKLDNQTHFKTSVQEEFEETPLIIAILCYFSYVILNIFGHLRDIMSKMGCRNLNLTESNRKGYVPLYRNFESFFTRNVYRRLRHGWNHPISSAPGKIIEVLDRVSDDKNLTFKLQGTHTQCINMGSYNYLGFAENQGPRAEAVKSTIEKFGVAVGTSRHELGTLKLHCELETLLAEFLGVEDSAIFGMGFATNSTNIPNLVEKGCLILSDELNHASLILGCRLSQASVKVFKHNNMKDLEMKLRNSIVEGQPKTHRPWKKIIIMIEGIYSMEGSIVNLPEVIRLKKQYKAYIYLDEAHSVGALGKNGKGVADYFGCDLRDVDVLMGTFTKSFGAAGGYIAGSKKLIDHIRVNSHSFCYGTSMSPPIVEQILSTLKVIMGLAKGDEGRVRIQRLVRNSRYFRQKLKQLGFIVYGNDDSPVVPMLIYFPAKIVAFVNAAKSMGVATVGVGFPATPLIESRVRFCISASHTKETLDKALEVTNALGDKFALKYSRRQVDKNEIVY